MLSSQRALALSVLVLGACAGAESADTTAAATATGETAPGAPATLAPVTGTIHEVRMLGDDRGYRYEPASLTIKQGDGIKWIMVSGAPHNVAFDPVKIPDVVEAQLSANMLSQSGVLASPMLLSANETYTISFAGIQPGTYDYVCTPHQSMGMTGKITVR